MLLNIFGKYASSGVGFILAVLLTALAAYLLGSINFSIIITRKTVDKDIRSMGSGNAGFTNVLRTVGKKPAVITMIADFIKCIIAITIGMLLFGELQFNHVSHTEMIGYGKYIAGFFCILGHMFPCYFGFKGGKGVVTSCALILMVDWRIWILVFCVFMITFIINRIVSLSSICGMISFPIITFCVIYFIDYVLNDSVRMRYVWIATLISFAISTIVIIRHKGNIKRLINGTEKRITAKK